MKSKHTYCMTLISGILFFYSLFAQQTAPDIILQEGDFKTLSHIKYSADGTKVVGASVPAYFAFLGPVLRIGSDDEKEEELVYEDQTSISHIIVWDVRSGNMVVQLYHSEGWGYIRDLSISPDGRFIASLYENAVIVWDLEGGSLEEIERDRAKLVIDSGNPRSMDFSPDGKYLVIGAKDLVVYTLNKSSPKHWKSKYLRKHKKRITVFDFNQDGSKIVTGHANGDIQIIDLDAGQVLSTYRGHRNKVQSISSGPFGNMVASGAKDNLLKVWDAKQNKIFLTKKFNDNVRTVAFTLDGKQLLARVQGEASVRVLEVSTGASLAAFNNVINTKAIYASLSFSPDGKYLAISGFGIPHSNEKRNKSFKIFDYKKQTLVKEVQLREPTPVTSLCFNENSTQIITHSNDHYLKHWDLITAELTAAIPTPKNLAKVIVNPNMEHIVYQFPNRAELCNYLPGEQFENRQIIKTFSEQDVSIEKIITSFDNHQVACFNSNKTMMVWDLNQVEKPQLSIKTRLPKWPEHMMFSLSKQYLIGIEGRVITIWDVHQQNRIVHSKKLKQGKGNVKILYLVPKGDHGFSIIYDVESSDDKGNYLETIDAKTGKQKSISPITLLSTVLGIWRMNDSDVDTYSPHSFDVPIMYAYSMDGKRYAAADIDDKNGFQLKIGLTDSLLNDPLGQFNHPSPIRFMTFNKTGDVLATCGHDGVIKLWNANAPKLVVEIVHRDKDYVFLLRQKDKKPFYKMSKGANMVSFRVGKEVYPFESFDVEYNRHHEILRAITHPVDGIIPSSSLLDSLIIDYEKAFNKRLEKMGINADVPRPEVVKINNIADVPIETTTRNLHLDIMAKDEASTIQQINIWINDVPLFKREDRMVEPAKKVQKAIDIKLSKGLNKIQVSAVNTQGGESLPYTLYINFNASDTVLPDLHLITLGIASYLDANQNLRFPTKDATDLAQLFQQQQGLYENIFTYSLTEAEVTKENVLKLRENLMKSQVDDHVILFMAGHGLLDNQEDFYFATYDTDFSNPGIKGIPFAMLESVIDGIPARNKLMLIDACHSGEVDKSAIRKITASRTIQGKKKFRSGDSETDIEAADGYKSFTMMRELFVDLRRGAGATVISAARGIEKAEEDEKWSNGVFTFCLRNGLGKKEADYNQDRSITLSEIQQYVSIKVPELTDYRQQPTTRRENIINDLVIWKY